MKYYKTDNRADYCEFFESVQGFDNEKLPRGTTVVLVEDKIRPALPGEVPFGAISSFPIMAGNSGGADAGTVWGGKYLKDEFGNFIWESVEMWELSRDTIASHNSEKLMQKIKTDKKHKLIGLVSEGKVPKGAKVRTKLMRRVNNEYNENQTYIPRMKRPEWNMVGLIGKVKILKGQPVAPNWIKMKEISENVEEWLIR